MKWLDKYRYFGRRGQVIYVLPRRYRVLVGRITIFIFASAWGLGFLSLWTHPILNWLGLGVAGLLACALMLFGRLKGRRVVLGHGFQSASTKLDLRGVLVNIVVWSVGILLFWLILQTRP